MGNVPGGTRGDSDDEEDPEAVQGNDADGQTADASVLDLGRLFNGKQLREVLAGLKDSPPGRSPTNNGALRRCVNDWLADRIKRNESTVSSWQFCQHVAKQDQDNLLNKEECAEFFARFDTDSDGVVPVAVFKTLFSAFQEDLNSLSISVSMLKKSPLMPGFLDAFAESKGLTGEHGKQLLMFLLRNRPADEMMSVPFTYTLQYTSNLRWSAVEAHIKATQEDNAASEEGKDRLAAGMSLEVLKQWKCFSAVDVSSNSAEMSNMMSSEFSSYWQSRGPVHSHWIQIRMRPGVCLKRLAIGVSERDASYMPQDVAVLAGSSKSTLRSHVTELSSHVVPSSFFGEFALAENIKTFYNYITIRIHRCRSDGHDTRIHSLTVSGLRIGSAEKSASLTDVTGVWLIGLMGNTAMATMHLVPTLRNDLMQRTTVAVNQMPPLALSVSSKERPASLTPALLDELSRFVRSLLMDATGNTSPFGLANLVKFAIARGGMAAMLEAAVLLQENGDVELPGIRPWLQSLSGIMSRLTQSNGSPLQMAVISSNKSKDNSKTNSLPAIVSTNRQADDVFVTKAPGATFLFSLESRKSFFLTSLSSKMPKNSATTRFAVVFGVREECDENVLLEKFSDDEWTADLYEEKVNDLKSGKIKPPCGEFLGAVQIRESWDVIPLFQGHHLLRYIAVKFFEPMKDSEDPSLNFKVFNFSGYVGSENDILSVPASQLEELSPLAAKRSSVPASHVLLRLLVFLADLTQLQVLTKAKQKNPLYDMENVTVMSWWKLYKLLVDRADSPAMVLCRTLALNMFRRLLPSLIVHSKEVTSKKARRDKEREDAGDADDDEPMTSLAGSPADALASLMSPLPAAEPTAEEIADGFVTLHNHLAALVDDDGTPPSVLHVAESVIVEGAEAFFPDASARCEHILERIDELAGDTVNKMSRILSFESLCRFYSRSDSRSLLGLPADLAKFEKQPVLRVLSKLLTVSYQKTMRQLSDAPGKDGATTSSSADGGSEPGSPVRMAHELVVLLCALQRTMTTWVAKNLNVPTYVKATKSADKASSASSPESDSSSGDASTAAATTTAATGSSTPAEAASSGCADGEKKDAVDKEALARKTTAVLEDVEELLCEYTREMAEKCVSCIEAALQLKDTKKGIVVLESSIVGMAFRQLLLLLRLFSSSSNLRTPLMNSMVKVFAAIQRVAEELPSMFAPLSSPFWEAKAEDILLQTWEAESSHRYDNNMDLFNTFDAPGCSQYIIDFDPRCETERRYDYLEFTDCHGVSKRFDNKVSSAKWPLTVKFPGGGPLTFHFHSDGSNVEWGFKFKITALGRPEVAIPWLYDVQLALAEVLGLLTGGCLKYDKASMALSANKKKNKAEEGESAAEGDDVLPAGSKEDADILLERLWSTVFRGGFMQKKLHRSLSGQFAANPTDSRVNELLRNVADRKEGMAQDFLKKCQSKRRTPAVGGELVNKSVAAVFAALCWHSQVIREQLVTLVGSEVPSEVSTEIQLAFVAADSLRRQLVDRRQQLLLQSEDAQLSAEKKAAIDPEEPATSCREKALFLLKFSGMSKEHKATDNTDSDATPRPKWLIRPDSWDRVYEHVQSEGQVEQMKAFAAESQSARSPLFRMILDFVTNSTLSESKVIEIMGNRRKRAVEIADAYLYAAEYVRVIGLQNNELQLATLVYLQNMLQGLQPGNQHYADALDGCGLEIETSVRKSYYMLVKRLIQTVTEAATSSRKRSRSAMARLAFIKCVLHLLDVHWEDYDYRFITDISLPEFLITVCKLSFESHVLPKFEVEQLERHRRYLQWLPDASTDYSSWSNARTRSDNLHLFISSFSEELSNITVSCDMCQDTISPPRFRCLDCRDYDVCSSCWAGLSEKKCPDAPAGEDHRINEMRWGCDQCRMLIIGTRIHCDVCDNFDLCLGCHYAGATPLEHLPSHPVSRHCTIYGYTLSAEELRDRKDEQGPDIEAARSLSSYVHHHSWNLFSASTISLSQFLQNSAASGQSMDDNDYIGQAGVLLRRCVRLLTCSVVDISEATKEEAAKKATTTTTTTTTAAVAAASIAAAGSETTSSATTTPALELATLLGALEHVRQAAVAAGVATDGTATSTAPAADEASAPAGRDSPSSEQQATATSGDDTPTESSPSADATAAETTTTTTETQPTEITVTTPADETTPDGVAVAPQPAAVSVAAADDDVAAAEAGASLVSPPVERSQSVDSVRRKHAPLTVTFSLPEDAAAQAAAEAATGQGHQQQQQERAAEDGAGQTAVAMDSMDIAAEVTVVADDADSADDREPAAIPPELEGILLEALSDTSSLSGGSYSPGTNVFSPLSSVLEIPGEVDFSKHVPSAEDKQFAMACCEQVLGMLGTLLTPERIVLWCGEHEAEFEVFLRTELLPALFALASMALSGKSIIQSVALALLGRLLGLLRPELCDCSLAIYKEKEKEEDKTPASQSLVALIDEADVDSSIAGMATISYLFALGTQRFQNSDLEGAALIVDLLQHTCSRGVWRQPTSICMSSCLEKLSTMSLEQTVNISAVFGICVLTGLPYVHRAGMLCRHIPSNPDKKGGAARSDEEGRQVIILSYDAEKSEMEIVDVETRLKSVVKEESIMEDSRHASVDTSCFPKLLDLLENLLPTAASDGLSSVEGAVVLSLVLKAIVNCIQDPTSPAAAHSVSALAKATGSSGSVTSSVTSSSSSPAVGTEAPPSANDASTGSADSGDVNERVKLIIDKHLIQLLVQLAGRGTSLSTSWTLEHLELLCFTLFQPSLLKDAADDSTDSTTLQEEEEEGGEDKKAIIISSSSSSQADKGSDSEEEATATLEGAVITSGDDDDDDDDNDDDDDDDDDDGNDDDDDNSEETEEAGAKDEDSNKENAQPPTSAEAAKEKDRKESDKECEKAKMEDVEEDGTESKKEAKDESDSKTEVKDESDSKKEAKDESDSKKEAKDESDSKKEAKDESDSKTEVKDESDGNVVQGENPLDDISQEGKETLLTVHDAFNTPLSILRAMYEKVNRDRTAMIDSVRRLFDGDSVSLEPSGEIRQMAKRWEPKPKQPEVKKTRGDGLTDVGLIPFNPSSEESCVKEATKEEFEVYNALELLIPPNKGDVERGEQLLKIRRKASKVLMKTELAKKSASSRPELLKWQSAVAIMQARHVVGEILAHWPIDMKLVTHLFSRGEESSLYALLDLLHDSLPWTTFKKVLMEAVKHVEESHLLPLCQAAGQCMRDNVMQKKTAESEHRYSNNMNESGSVSLPGSSSVHIAFDSRCSTENGCDILVVSSSLDYTQNMRELHGARGSDAWMDIDLPGDTVYWKFRTDSSHTEWGWKMTVTGGGIGRFETGYSLLDSLLDSGDTMLRSLPFPQLCKTLVSVSCTQISTSRIKSLGLLLKMMHHVQRLAIGKEKGPDLCQLRPLWVLYTHSLEKVPSDGDVPYLAPEVTLALTELFYVVENLVQEWGIQDDFIIGMATPEGLHDTLSKGISTVAFIGAAIGVPNKATVIFQEEYVKAFAAAAEAARLANEQLSVKNQRRGRGRSRRAPSNSSSSQSSDSDSEDESEMDSFLSEEESSGPGSDYNDSDW